MALGFRWALFLPSSTVLTESRRVRCRGRQAARANTGPRRPVRSADAPEGSRPGPPRPPARHARKPGPRPGRLLTHGQSHQAVREEAGGEEGSPERDVQLLRDLGLDPHEQAGRERGAQPGPGLHPRRCGLGAGDLLLDLL